MSFLDDLLNVMIAVTGFTLFMALMALAVPEPKPCKDGVKVVHKVMGRAVVPIKTTEKCDA
jgi:hypothetical protein